MTVYSRQGGSERRNESAEMPKQERQIHYIWLNKQWYHCRGWQRKVHNWIKFIPLRSKRVGKFFWNQAQKNFTHPQSECHWVSVSLSLCNSVANKLKRLIKGYNFTVLSYFLGSGFRASEGSFYIFGALVSALGSRPVINLACFI